MNSVHNISPKTHNTGYYGTQGHQALKEPIESYSADTILTSINLVDSILGHSSRFYSPTLHPPGARSR